MKQKSIVESYEKTVADLADAYNTTISIHSALAYETALIFLAETLKNMSILMIIYKSENQGRRYITRIVIHYTKNGKPDTDVIKCRAYSEEQAKLSAHDTAAIYGKSTLQRYYNEYK